MKKIKKHWFSALSWDVHGTLFQSATTVNKYQLQQQQNYKLLPTEPAYVT